MDFVVPGQPSGAFAPKLLTGIDLVDRSWGGFYRGGTYLVYGRVASGRDLFALRFLQAGVEAGETCLFISPARPKDLMIQAASIGFDLRQGHAAGRVRMLRIPPSLSQGGEEDEGIARALRDLVALVRQHRPQRLILGDFTPFVLFRSFDRFRAALIEMLEHTDGLDTTSVLVMSEPANAQSKRVLEFVGAQMTGSVHIEMPADEETSVRRVTLLPNIGHVRRRLVETWDLDEILDDRPAPSATGAPRRLSETGAAPSPREIPTPYAPIRLGTSAGAAPTPVRLRPRADEPEPYPVAVWMDDAPASAGEAPGEPPAFANGGRMPPPPPAFAPPASSPPTPPPAFAAPAFAPPAFVPSAPVPAFPVGDTGAPWSAGAPAEALADPSATPFFSVPLPRSDASGGVPPPDRLRTRPAAEPEPWEAPAFGARGPSAPAEATAFEANPEAAVITRAHADRAAFARTLDAHYRVRRADGTPFVAVAIRLEQAAGVLANPLSFEFLSDLVAEASEPGDALFVEGRTERLILLLPESTPDAAAAFFGRLKQRLRDEAPYQAEDLLHAVSAIVVPNGEPFGNGPALLAYALGDG